MTRDAHSVRTAAFSLSLIALTALIGLVGCGWAEDVQPPADLVAQCRADLAGRLDLPEDQVTLAGTYSTTWSDTSLGLPQAGLTYAQVMTPGWQLLLEAGGLAHLYTTSEKSFKYGGPVPLWRCSLLYLKPIENEPNGNSELWQSSLIGTNPVRLCSGVSDFWPQSNGLVVFKRRMSRSTHELYWMKVDGEQAATLLVSGMDFADAAVDEAGEAWAVISRPSLGSEWQVEYGVLSGTEARVLPLPEGAQGWLSKLAWTEGKLVALVKMAEGQTMLEADPSAPEPKWEPAGSYYPPPKWDELMLLNKSFSLVIGPAPIALQGAFGGLLDDPAPVVPTPMAPAVEIGSMHFLGDCEVIARIPRLVLGGYELIGSNEADQTRFAFIWGKQGTRQAAYVVDYVSGQVLQSFLGARKGHENPKLFESPCLVDPLPVIVHVEPVDETE